MSERSEIVRSALAERLHRDGGVAEPGRDERLLAVVLALLAGAIGVALGAGVLGVIEWGAVLGPLRWAAGVMGATLAVAALGGFAASDWRESVLQGALGAGWRDWVGETWAPVALATAAWTIAAGLSLTAVGVLGGMAVVVGARNPVPWRTARPLRASVVQLDALGAGRVVPDPGLLGEWPEGVLTRELERRRVAIDRRTAATLLRHPSRAVRVAAARRLGGGWR